MKLQDALDIRQAVHEGDHTSWTIGDLPWQSQYANAGEVVEKAARQVANPDIEAMAKAMANYAGYDGTGPGPDYWLVMAKVGFDAALGITKDTKCSCPTNGLHARWCPDAPKDTE